MTELWGVFAMGVPASNVVSGLTGGNGLAAAGDASSCIEKLHRFRWPTGPSFVGAAYLDGYANTP
jgi:hypothetical protein